MPLTAWAQASERDPLDMRTATPPPVYESAFSDYKPYQDPEIISWKAANDVVREFGGMAAMKTMGEGDSSAHDAPAATPPATPSKSKPADMKTMPGHDMSTMPQNSPANAPKPAAPAMPNSAPGHGGMSH